MTITTALLDALLSSNASLRQEAEAHLSAISLQDRILQLVSMIVVSTTSAHPIAQQQLQQQHHAVLSCVLLRKAVSALPSTATTATTTATAVQLCQHVMSSLLQYFVQTAAAASTTNTNTNNNHATTAKAAVVCKQVGYCLTEVLCSISTLSTAVSTAEAALESLLAALEPLCRTADATSLGLLANVAERLPTLLLRQQQAQLQAQHAAASSTTTTTTTLACVIPIVEMLCEAVKAFHDGTTTSTMAPLVNATCQVAIAMNDCATTSTATSTATTTTSSGSNHGSRAATTTLGVVLESSISQLGTTCLVPLLVRMQHVAAQTAHRNEQQPQEQELLSCLQYLEQAVSSSSTSTFACPARPPRCSLLALFQNLDVLQALVQTSLAMLLLDEIHHSTKEVQLAALQLLASLCAANATALPNHHVVVSNAILQTALPKCAQLAVDGVDDNDDGVEEWACEPAQVMDDIPTWDEDDVALHAESLLASLVESLGGTLALPVVLPLVEKLLSSTSSSSSNTCTNPQQQDVWKQQRAALSILSECLFAAPITFAPHVPVAVETALELACKNPNSNVRVQFQALVLLGALCEAHGQDIRATRNGTRILEVLCHFIAGDGGGAHQSMPCSKIVAVACLGLVSYCRGDSSSGDSSSNVNDAIVPVLQNLLTALVTGPLSWDMSMPGAVAVKIRAIGALACMAQSTGDAFGPYYAQVMPGLLACARLPGSSYEMSRLRGAALEAATIIGQAVSETNRAFFVGDAEQIMQMAMPILQADEALSSGASLIPTDELLSACARIASVMREEYAPFVGIVLPHLLKRVSAPPDMHFSEGDEAGLEATKRGEVAMHEEDGNENMTFTMSLPGKGITKVTVNTTKIQEKAQAARAIYEHAAALGSSFAPYAQTTLTALLPLINFRYSPEVRATVAQAISPVYDSSLSSERVEVSQKALPQVAEALSKQIAVEDHTDPEVLFALADSLSDVFYFTYRTLDQPGGRQILASYSPAQAKSTVQCIMKAMVECLDRRSQLLRKLRGYDGALSGEDEKDEYLRALDGEQEVLTPLVDVVGYTIKFLRADAIPLFESDVAPVLAPYLKAGAVDTRARFAAVCLFDDCVEHCGSAAAARYAPYLVEGALLGIDETTNGHDVELKQVSLYGIAQMARYAPSSLVVPQAQGLVNMLTNLCNVPKDSTENVAMIENAVSALASLTLIGNAPLGKSMDASTRSSILSKVLDQLPLREDEDEAKIIHAGLCDLVENDQGVLLLAEAERLLCIIADVFSCISEGEDVASPDTQCRMAKILFQMQSTVPQDRMHAAFGALPEASQQCIHSVMNEFRSQLGSNLVSP